jgi:hypothetical protein
MGAKSETNNERHLLANIAEVASILGDEGRDFNQHLARQFKGWDRVKVKKLPDMTAMLPEHLLFFKAIAQTLNWLQQLTVPNKDERDEEARSPGAVPIIYLRVLLEARAGLIKSTGERLEQLLEQGQREPGMRRPRRLLAVVAGLQTWSRVELPDISSSHDILDLEEVQRLALSACGRARWTALAPLKMYAIYKLSEGVHLPTLREIFPPMGSAVSRGIERLFGFTLGESENDYTISRGLHLKLADVAHTTIWDINSGFYRLGGGS